MDTYKKTNYKVEQWMDDEEPGSLPKYVYTVYFEYHEHESDEWYFSESDAHTAAKETIDRSMDGPDEPDYDAPTFAETYQKSWEQDQQLKGR